MSYNEKKEKKFFFRQFKTELGKKSIQFSRDYWYSNTSLHEVHFEIQSDLNTHSINFVWPEITLVRVEHVRIERFHCQLRGTPP